MPQMEVITHEINGVLIGQKRKDGYVNATALCKAHERATGEKKQPKDWYTKQRHIQTIHHLAVKLNLIEKDSSPSDIIPGYSGLIIVNNGGNSQGTWIHPKLATRFAIWLSDDFGFLVEEIVESWVVSKTPLANDAIALMVSNVIREPKAWEVHFTPDWIREADRLTGWSWKWSCMAGFINRSVYNVFPLEFRKRLDEVNPILPHGKRGNKHHQHVASSFDETVLKQVIAETLGMMRGSVSLQDYYRSHHNAYSNGIQLTFTLGATKNA